MWAVEKDPALRSDFTNVTILDRTPDVDRLRAKAGALVAAVPRLAQRVVNPPLRLAPPEWQDDPTFDLDHHLRHVALPASGTRRELLDYAAAVSADPFDRSRPLWEFTLVDGLPDGRSALVQRLHHTITDGVGGLRLSLSLVDFERDPDPAPSAPEGEPSAPDDDAPVRTSPVDVLRSSLAYAASAPIHLAREGAGAAVCAAKSPQRIPAAAVDAWQLARSVRRQVLVTDRARSPLFATRSLGRRYDVLQVPLEPLRVAADVLGGTVNDAFVTAVTGALGRYHAALGVRCADLRMAMPVNLRSEGMSAGNAFAPARVIVPIQPAAAASRFHRISEILAAARTERALHASGSLAGLMSPLPTSVLVAATRSQVRTIDFATSNLRGSPVPLYLAGARIEANFPLGPRTGSALNLTVLSYEGRFDIGIHTDPVAVTHPELLLICLRESFADLTSVRP